MEIIGRIAGIALFAVGAWIIVLYWIHWVRFGAMRLGWGNVKGTSMVPFVGPLLAVLGAALFGEPLKGGVGWWMLLADSNTYVLVASLPALAGPRLRAAKDTGLDTGKRSGP